MFKSVSIKSINQVILYALVRIWIALCEYGHVIYWPCNSNLKSVGRPLLVRLLSRVGRVGSFACFGVAME